MNLDKQGMLLKQHVLHFTSIIPTSQGGNI
jgi:hypothetical protein